MGKNFAITGVAGYVAPRHLKAIRDTGSYLVAALDPKDSVGVLDQYSFETRFFPEFERFDRHLEKLRRGHDGGRVDYLSVCSPNYLHDAHVRLALRIGADAICEKPLVINPRNLDALQELERETERKINTILQLRVHPALIDLKAKLDSEIIKTKHEVVLTYITGRGAWYAISWKGSVERSGGLATNIGVHFFDLLMWLFGGVEDCKVHLNQPNKMAGFLGLKNANVRWYLSVDIGDLPFVPLPGSKTTCRSIAVDGKEVEFVDGFMDLHTVVYRRTLEGYGFGVEDARPSIELAYRIGTSPLANADETSHPYLFAN